MNFLSQLFSSTSPSRLARTEVDGFLKELKSRPRHGDPALHQKLNQLNEKAGALDPEVLTEAYEKGSAGDSHFAQQRGLEQVKKAVNAGQTGFARQLAAEIMADGSYSEAENLAVRQMVNPPLGLRGYGHGIGQQLLSPNESQRLRSFSAAPNDGIRSWMLEQSPGKPVDMPAVQDLAETFFENGSLDWNSWVYATNLPTVFDSPVEKSSQFFLYALNGTDPDLRRNNDKDSSGISYREWARQQDSGSDQQPGPCEKAYLAGLEFSRQKGLSDSAQARALFPKK
jgi:hypothetical protein